MVESISFRISLPSFCCLNKLELSVLTDAFEIILGPYIGHKPKCTSEAVHRPVVALKPPIHIDITPS